MARHTPPAPAFAPSDGWLTTTWKGGHNSAGAPVFAHDARVRQLAGGGCEAWFFDDDVQAARLRAVSTSTKAGGNVWRQLTAATAQTLYAQIPAAVHPHQTSE
jgi:hypothetical protein